MTTSVFTAGGAFAQTFDGRVDSFYNGERCLYSETYEPPRATPLGYVGRIESRFIGGRWRHVAFDEKGQRINGPREEFALFDQNSLPLFFDPAECVDMARKLLTASGKNVLTRPNNVVIYGNKGLLSVGVIRLKCCI